VNRLQTVAAILVLLGVIAVTIATGSIILLGVPVQIGEAS
jgi:hypothetical protein